MTKHIHDILEKPLISEKIVNGSDNFNRYGFIVALKANKYQIKKSVETLYNVRVLSVNTSIRPGKPKKTSKGGTNKTSKRKIAIVQIDKGQTIEFFQGV